MYYSLVSFPAIEKEKINGFRIKYDPFVNLVDFHISLVFPIKFPCEITEDKLIEHTQAILKKQVPFEIHLQDLKKAWDHWLFLLLKEGNGEVIKIHDALYTGVLSKYLRKDIEFIPHVAIGSFVKKGAGYDLKDPKALPLNKELYDKALQEANRLNLDYTYKFNKVSLIKLNDDFTKCELVKEFLL